MTVRTRFAPSPTGYLHIGGARTALFSWLHARQSQGVFVLRIEDTDAERSTPEAVQAILDGLSWLELDWDEGPYFQSQRTERYREVIHQLLEAGQAYHCYCTKEELDAMREEQRAQGKKPMYDGRCRHRTEPREGVPPVVRFLAPDSGKTVVEDRIHGTVPFDNAELDDLVIARSDGSPTYNLTVVVDDWDMGITDVIRGDDHLNNTPRQMQILAALGVEPPRYAHVPMILGEDKKRLSKRHGAVSVLQYKEDGFLPEALVNGLARLGWSHGDEEIFARDDLLRLFSVDAVGKTASVFNQDKLLWLNGHYIRERDPADLVEPFKEQLRKRDADPEAVADLLPIVESLQERSKTLAEMAETGLFFFRDFEEFDEKAAKKNLKPAVEEPLRAVRDGLAGLGEWSGEAVHGVIQEVVDVRDMKFGKVAQPIRVAVSGGAVSPPIDVTLQLLGQSTTIERLDRALAYIRERAEQAE
ncbi:glutamyl-Q tRNA(Asp) ligase [Thiohalorhabdus denitrificans]|uniref:Glutamate--tRNA ligase n=1 Tax=Thiohalorhabdus denitrificans TaxID=381306 RepID=A0A0P9CR45_9GAMM|nr:glutamate--tRNA ligase [Thiohalorhabdus denitrificans]KPV39152.1 glutamyl-Q tRNA(Asp) ligase [Thiohalorhabdus denitrificans]SCX76261.1 glutamyl-tRNA synthetase [Thiohalorhabdus denitrificans]